MPSPRRSVRKGMTSPTAKNIARRVEMITATHRQQRRDGSVLNVGAPRLKAAKLQISAARHNAPAEIVIRTMQDSRRSWIVQDNGSQFVRIVNRRTLTVIRCVALPVYCPIFGCKSCIGLESVSVSYH